MSPEGQAASNARPAPRAAINIRACAAAGRAGTGKTALATYLATSLKFPFVKLVDFFAIMGRAEGSASDVLRKAFDDAAKSPLSVLILDDVSKLVQFAKHGMRYSLLLLHTLQSLLKQRPQENRRMVVLATADANVTEALELADSFAHVIKLPTLTREEAAVAIKDSHVAQDPRTLQAAVAQLPSASVFDTSIRTLTASLLQCSPGGQLDLTAWEGWQHAFQAPPDSYM